MSLTDVQKAELAAELIEAIPEKPLKAIIGCGGCVKLVFDPAAADLREDAITTAHRLLGEDSV